MCEKNSVGFALSGLEEEEALKNLALLREMAEGEPHLIKLLYEEDNYMRPVFYQLIIFLLSFLLFCCNPSSSVCAGNNEEIGSYLEGNDANGESLSFAYVQSCCAICWGEGKWDPWVGRRAHRIVYVDDPEIRVKRDLFPDDNSAEVRKHIIFMISFYKFADEKIVNRKIMLPDDRFNFYLQPARKSKDGKGNPEKLNIQSGYIELESLGEDRKRNNTTVGNFSVCLSDDECIKGRFVVKPFIYEYGP